MNIQKKRAADLLYNFSFILYRTRRAVNPTINKAHITDPVITIRGTLPSRITPKIDLRGLREFRRSSLERILSARKNRKATTMFNILSRTARYMKAETR